jgi:hypothetical protein
MAETALPSADLRRLARRRERRTAGHEELGRADRWLRAKSASYSFTFAASTAIAKKIWTVWSFFCYDDREDVDLWATWYHGVDPRTQAAHDERLDSLEQREAHEWREPLTRDLGEGLIEIKS